MPLGNRIILLLLLSLIPLIHAQCPAGRVREHGRCVRCPGGTFATREDAVCQPCPSGTFQPFRGAKRRKVCRFCYPGTFSNATAATRCENCPTGQVSPAGATACLTCPPGSPLSGRECEPCRSGTYDDAGKCRRCPGGLSSPEGAVSVAQCAPCRELGNCRSCPRNFFQMGLDCVRCPAGSRTSGEGSTSESECRPCPAGFFLDENDFTTDRCKACRRGTTSARGSDACRNPRLPCPRGRFEDINKNCRRCLPGFRYDPGQKDCVRCPEGFAGRGGLSTECIKCGPMLRADIFSSGRCECPEGTFFVNDTTCKPCPPGTSQISTWHRTRRCMKCDPGTFSDRPGTIDPMAPRISGCPNCPFGLVSLVEDATECEECPDGLVPAFQRGELFFPFFGSDRCVKPTDGCEPGFELMDDVFGRPRCRPVFCRPGTSMAEFGKTCVPCRPGFIQTNEEQTCQRCPRRYVSAGGTQKQCTRCGKGFVRDSDQGDTCSCRGNFADGKGIQEGSCRRCPPGTASQFSSEDDGNVCVPCRPGTFNANEGESFCFNCPVNSFSGEGAAECTPCPPGFVTRGRGGAENCERF